MQANAYTASFDAAGNFTKTFHESPTDARTDGKERAAAGHFQTRTVSFDGRRQVFTTSVLSPVTPAGKAG